jgi:hypothetical protein
MYDSARQKLVVDIPEYGALNTTTPPYGVVRQYDAFSVPGKVYISQGVKEFRSAFGTSSIITC